MEINDRRPGAALLIMDIQAGTIKLMEDSGPLLESTGKAAAFARSAGIPVIYVLIGFRKGYPEVSPANRSFSAIKDRAAFLLDVAGETAIPPAVKPQPDDIMVVKKRISAFTGSDLEVVLRSLGVRHIVLTGIATSGVVLSTLREAADKDYRITVLSDCCADRDDEVHRVLLEKVFPRQAAVITSEAWISS